MVSKWRIKADSVINKTVQHWLTKNGLVWIDIYKLDSIQAKAIIKDIDKAYPFGQRCQHPYKCWLASRKDFIRKYLSCPQSNYLSLPLFNA